MTTPLRALFFGTPQEAVPFLDVLVESGIEILGVVTQPPRRRGRGAGMSLSPVHERAESLQLPVCTPQTRSELVEQVGCFEVELAIVVAYGRIIPPELLEQARYINVHFSKLPRWRGAAPVERAILSGDSHTAVALMEMEAALDTGAVLFETEVAITPDMTSGSLKNELVRVGVELLRAHVPDLLEAEGTQQEGEVTYAAKITTDEFRIYPERSSAEVRALVHAGDPRPGAWIQVAGSRIKIWSLQEQVSSAAIPTHGVGQMWMEHHEVHLGVADGSVILGDLQVEGRARMAATAWWHGNNLQRVEVDS